MPFHVIFQDVNLYWRSVKWHTLRGAGSDGDFRLDFDPRVRLEFHGSKISSDGGLLLYRELDEALGLFDQTVRFLRDTRKGKNGIHTLMGLLRQSVFGRLAGYDVIGGAILGQSSGGIVLSRAA